MSIVNTTHRTEDVQFQLGYMNEGVTITEFDCSGETATVENEWWYTWEHLFTELTGFTTDGDNLSIVHAHVADIE